MTHDHDPHKIQNNLAVQATNTEFDLILNGI